MPRTPVFFDLETTSLSPRAQVIQIGAAQGDNYRFNQYILPTCWIHPVATQVHNFRVIDGQLFQGDQALRTTTAKDAAKKFIVWLSQFHAPLLIAHNAARFDAPKLYRLFRVCDLEEEFEDLNARFADTLPLFRDQYPYLECHKLAFLVRELLDEDHGVTHDALDDALDLQQLVRISNVGHKRMLRYACFDER